MSRLITNILEPIRLCT